MRHNRAVARLVSGLLVVGSVALGAAMPAQAKDTGWNGTVAPSHSTTSMKPTKLTAFKDTGWNGT
jgi:hypothetical protein